MGMTAVFTGAPEFTVLHGRSELGRIDPSLLTEEVHGPRRLLLGGRSWQVTYVDWETATVLCRASGLRGQSRWTTGGLAGLGFELSRAIREVLLGSDPPVTMTRKAVERLAVCQGSGRSPVRWPLIFLVGGQQNSMLVAG
jgi:ATP-dependent Lhr-like helicase